jgi:hypothetical protein
MKDLALVRQLSSVLLLFALTVPALSLMSGSYSYGFFGGKEETSTTDTSNPKDPETTGTDTNNTERPQAQIQTVSTLKKAMSAAMVEGMITDRTAISLTSRLEDYQRLTAGITEITQEEEERLVQSDDYDSQTMKFVKGKVLASQYASGTQTVLSYSKKGNSLDASYVTVCTPITKEQPTLAPYMGYLLLYSENGTKVTLCNSWGEVLAENIADYQPYYARDKKNRPVFTDGESYYYFDESSATMVEISHSSIRSELFYDYPATPYAESGYEAVRVDNDTYGTYYNTATGSYRLGYYYKTYNFSEGYAVVILQQENDVRILNTSGKIIFSPAIWYYFQTGRTEGQLMYVDDHYRAPETYGIESIGCTGFDHGWLRIRIVSTSDIYSTAYGRVVQDKYFLINAKREFFTVPDGYEIAGYSDGVLLLEKDGLYGYYSINGYWIAQPIYDYAQPFIQGVAVVGFEDGTKGMIDTEGNIVLPFVFTSLSNLSSGVVTGYVESVGWETYYLIQNEQAETE